MGEQKPTHSLGRIRFNKVSFCTAMQIVSDIIERGAVCHQVVIANVHSLAMASRDPEFAKVCKESDLSFADGMPIVWASRLLGDRIPERIAGPDFMWEFTKVCAQKGYNVFLLGGREDSLHFLKKNLLAFFPKLRIVGAYSPPFGPWSQEQDSKMVKMVNASGAQILWLGVSTPKQDIWISKNKHLLKVQVAIGVGAAFDFHAGRIKRAPFWMQMCGLEWLYRLLQEPRRMWRRYLVSNVLFAELLLREFLRKALR